MNYFYACKECGLVYKFGEEPKHTDTCSYRMIQREDGTYVQKGGVFVPVPPPNG